MIASSAFPRVLVIGAGVSGLTTALLARRRGYDVTVVAERRAPHITSVVAGALWEWPPAVCGQHRDQLSLERSKEWAAESYQIFEQLAKDPATGVHVRPAIFYFRSPVELDAHELRKMNELRECVRGFRHDAELIDEHQIAPDAGVQDAYTYLAPMIDTDQYMEWLIEQVRLAGCELVRQRLTGRLVEQERLLCQRFQASAVVNCSGLGSIELAEEQMRPLRGAVIHARNDGSRGPVITTAHCMSFDEELDGQNMIFIVPRGEDRLVLGGLVEPDEWSTDLTLDSYPPISEMLDRCQRFLPALREIELIPDNPVRTGLRPYRQRNVRLEGEPGTHIVHNIGHGGSGFTFSWGCAWEAVTILDQIL